jgi:hypothetical protein
VPDYLATDTPVKVLEYSFSGQMTAQVWSVLTAIILSAVVSYVALMICKYTRACVPEQKSEGHDIAPRRACLLLGSAIQDTTEKRPFGGAFSCAV